MYLRFNLKQLVSQTRAQYPYGIESRTMFQRTVVSLRPLMASPRQQLLHSSSPRRSGLRPDSRSAIRPGVRPANSNLLSAGRAVTFPSLAAGRDRMASRKGHQPGFKNRSPRLPPQTPTIASPLNASVVSSFLICHLLNRTGEEQGPADRRNCEAKPSCGAGSGPANVIRFASSVSARSDHQSRTARCPKGWPRSKPRERWLPRSSLWLLLS